MNHIWYIYIISKTKQMEGNAMNLISIEIIFNGEIVKSASNMETVNELRKNGFEVRIVSEK